jgi:hypothetical protein
MWPELSLHLFRLVCELVDSLDQRAYPLLVGLRELVLDGREFLHARLPLLDFFAWTLVHVFALGLG